MRIVELPDVVEFESKDVNEKHLHSVVIIRDVPKTDWGLGGIPFSER